MKEGRIESMEPQTAAHPMTAALEPDCSRCRQEFLRGVTAVLAHMTTSGEANSTLYRETVQFIGAEELIRQARQDGAMRWSGLSIYVRWRDADA